MASRHQSHAVTSDAPGERRRRAADRELGSARSTERAQNLHFSGAVLEGLPVAVALLDRDGHLVFANKAARRLAIVMPDPNRPTLTQVSKYHLRDARTGRAIEPDGRFERALRGEALEPREYLFRPPHSKVDKRVRVTESPVARADGSIAGVAFTAVELPLAGAPDQLADASSLVRRVIEAIPLPIVLRDARGMVLAGNAATRRAFGSIARGSRGLSAVRLVEDGIKRSIDDLPSFRAARTGSAVRGEIHRARVPGGGVRSISVDAVPLKDEEGHVTSVVASYSDVTDALDARAVLANRGAEIDALSELAVQIASGAGVDRVAVAALRLTTPLVGADKAIVVDVDGTGLATVRAALDPRARAGIRLNESEAALIASGRAAITHELRMIEPSRLLRGTSSVLTVPIEIDGRQVGSIAWASASVAAFGADALRLGVAAAGLLAVAIRHDGVEGMRPDRAIALGHLTRREREVLVLMARGLSNREIAQRLRLSYTTERGYVRGVIEKLGAHSRIEAVAHALEAGILSG